MRILAVDTSTNVATIAVMEDELLLGEYICNKGKTHSQRLMPMVDSMLEMLGMDPSDMDVFAASVGPGSFTGLRIGVTTIKSMAFALEKPVISVPTLDALAYNVPMTDKLVCPMLDARNNQVFTAVYKSVNGKQERITEYLGVHISELAQILQDMKQKVVFLGDAMGMHKEFFVQELGDMALFAPANVALPKASSVAQLAYKAFLDGKQENCYDMVPFYLRKSQAEREREQRECK